MMLDDDELMGMILDQLLVVRKVPVTMPIVIPLLPQMQMMVMMVIQELS